MHFLVRVPVMAGLGMLSVYMLNQLILLVPEKTALSAQAQAEFRSTHAAGCLIAIRKQSREQGLGFDDAVITNYCRCLSAQYVEALETGVLSKVSDLESVRPQAQSQCAAEHL